MSIERINLGSTANDGTGDALRVAFQKINNNFAELNTAGGGGGANGPDWSVQFKEGNDITSVAYLGSTYVAVGKPNRVLTSADAGTWSINSTPTTDTLTAIISDGTQLVAVGANGAIETTTDAVTWATQTTAIADNLLAIAHNGSLYVAVGENGAVVTSPDAVTWSLVTTATTDTLRSVTWSTVNNAWVAVGDAGTVLVSAAAGTVWTGMSSGITEDLYDVETNGSILLAVGTNGAIINSADAISWSTGSTGVTTNLTSLAFIDVVTTTGTTPTAFIVGDSGEILSSADFGTWDNTTYVTPATQNLLNVTVANGQLIATGQNGTVVELIDGALVLDSISAGSSGSSKFIFNEDANLISIAADIVPQTDANWSLGSNTNSFGNVWITGGNGLHIGNVTVLSTTTTAANAANASNTDTFTTITLHETDSSNLSNLTINHLTATTIGVSGNVTFANVDITGTANIANLVAANANIDALVANTISANGVVSANGNLTVAGELTANTANIAYDIVANGNITSQANITADYFLGNGAYLTGIIKKAAGVVGSVQFANANMDFAGDTNLHYDDSTFTLYSDNFVGNVAGNVTGELTGNVTGNLTGNIVGNVLGNVAGNIVGASGTFDNLTVNDEITGNTANFAATTTTTAAITTATITTLQADVATTNTANITELIAANANIANANVTSANLTTARVTTLQATDETVGNSTVANLVATAANIATLTGNNATITTVTATTGNIATVNSTTVTATQVTATSISGNLAGNVQAGTVVATGNIDANNFNATGAFWGNLEGNVNANSITSNVLNATTSDIGIATASTVTAQTFTGNLVATTIDTGNMAATGNITALNATFSSNVNAVSVVATNLRGNLTGNVAGNVVGNVTAVNISVSGNANLDNINGQTATFTGDIQAANAQFLLTTVSNLTATGNIETTANLVADHVYANLITGTLTTATQSNITSVGTLDNLAVSGNGNINHVYANSVTVAGNIAAQNMALSGNLAVAGNITYTNVNQVTVESPLIDLGGGPNGNVLTANDGYDRGLVQHYFTTSAQNAYMGWKNDQQQYVFAARSTVANNIVTVTQLGNILAGNATLSNVSATNLTLTGDLTLDDATANRVTANFFTGDGSNLTGLNVMDIVAGSNVTVSDANGVWTINASLPAVGGNIDHAIQFADSNGNLASHGNLLYYTSNSTVIVTGDVNATDFNGDFNGTLYGNVDGNTATFSGAVDALSFTGDFNGNLTGNMTGNVTGNWGNFAANLDAATLNITGNAAVGNITANIGTFTTIGGSLTTADQSNITKVGSLSNLIVTGNITTGNLTGANLVSANYVTGTLTTAAQPNITSIGTLTALVVNGNIDAKDITSNTTITAPNVHGNLTGNVTGDLTGNVTGNISGATGAFTGAVTIGTTLGVTGNLTAANVAGGNLVSANYLQGTIITAAQPNITSIGSLTTLTVTGNTSVGNLSGANTVTANFFTGTLTTAAQPNITSVGSLTSLDVLGNIAAANVAGGNTVTANFLTGTLTTAAQPNITSTGNLTSLTVDGAASVGGAFTGNSGTFSANLGANNLTVTHTTTTANIIANTNANLGNIRIEGSNITEIGTADFLIKSATANLIISAPSSNTANSNASTLTLTTGYASGNARGGDLNLTTGNGNAANAGTINIISGSGEQTGTLGGNINIIAGNTIGSPATINGANILIQSGNSIDEDAGALILKGGEANGSYLFGGNIYLTPGLGDSANNANYDGRVIIGKSQHLWPNDLGNANAILMTDGAGTLSWANGDSLGGGMKNVEANGTSLFANYSTGNLKFTAGNVTLQTGVIQTVGITGIAAPNANSFGTVELRVTPTGIPVDSPFTANFDMSSSGNNLQDDFSSFANEVGTKWLWDLSQVPKAGLLKHDLGLLT